MDASLRVFSCHSHNELLPGKPILVAMLERHDAQIVDLDGPTEAGGFASMDASGRVCVWSADFSQISEIPAPSSIAASVTAGRTLSLGLAIHPTLPSIAIEWDCAVYVLDVLKYPVHQAAAETHCAKGVISSVLTRAELANGRRDSATHSDSVASSWQIDTSSVPFAESLALTQTLRRIAAVTRSLQNHIEEAVCILWAAADTSTTVELEDLAHGRAEGAESAAAARSGLLKLLRNEILNGRNLPQFRLAAAAAYLGTGSLGVTELNIAFGSGSDIRDLLPRLDEGIRKCAYSALNIHEGAEPELVLRHLENVIAEVARALTEAREHLGSLLVSMEPLTLILKGGGAKGIAHVGALHEVRKYFLCDRIVGTSAGAIVAVLVGAGFTDAELRDELFRVDFGLLARDSWWQCCLNLVIRGGLHSAKGLQTWLDIALAKKLKSPTQVLLRQLPLHTTVYACQGSDPAVTFDSRSDGSNFEPASYATRCSMSIPLYFTPESKSGAHIFDGGLRHNYPVELLLKDAPKTKFIGLYLGAPTFEGMKTGVPSAALDALLEAQDTAQLRKYGDRTIIIDTRPIGTLDLSLSEQEKTFLFLAGQVAAIDFLSRQGIDLSKRSDISSLRAQLDLLRETLSSDRIRKRRTRRAVVVASFVTALAGLAATHWHWLSKAQNWWLAL
jgi:predicted acylesterase/phospholipase RssA